jgi:hypothetical protein
MLATAAASTTTTSCSTPSSSTDHNTDVSRFVLLNRTYFLMSKWAAESFSLRISDGRYVWEGRAGSSFIKEKLLPPGMAVAQYLATVRDALSQQDQTNEKYSYDLVQLANPECAELCWQIRLGGTSKGLSVCQPIENYIYQRVVDWLFPMVCS